MKHHITSAEFMVALYFLDLSLQHSAFHDQLVDEKTNKDKTQKDEITKALMVINNCDIGNSSL